MTTFVHDEPVMGTVVSFRAEHDSLDEQAARAVIGSASRLLHWVDSTFSTWKPSSPMSRLRRGELTDPPPEIAEVLALCQTARQLSGGWFDPWAMPGGVDPTGLVKGWAVEGALEVLVEAGMEAAVVNGGGDVASLARPGRPWRFGVRHPWRADALACVVETSGAVATSGSYERGQHLVVPEGLVERVDPRRRPVSATVTGERLAFADAWATALCVGGDEVLALLEATRGYEGYVIFADGEEAWTEKFPFATASDPDPIQGGRAASSNCGGTTTPAGTPG